MRGRAAQAPAFQADQAGSTPARASTPRLLISCVLASQFQDCRLAYLCRPAKPIIAACGFHCYLASGTGFGIRRPMRLALQPGW